MKENNFKQTEIGLIPEDWEVMRLGEVSQIKLGRTPERKKKKYWENGSIPWVKIQDLNNGVIYDTSEKISEIAFKEKFRGKFIPKDTLLVSFKLTIGRVGILGIDAVHREGIASLFLDEQKVNKKFLFFLLQHIDYDAYLDNYVKGRTLNKEKLSIFLIPFPPLSEQQKIAKVLDKIQQAIEIQDKIIEQAKNLKKSLMQKLFTEGLYGEEQKETEIGLIPKSWEVVRLGDCIKLIRNGITKKQNKEGRGFPVTRIETISEGFIDPAKVGYIEGLTQKEIEKYKLKKGDILFSHINSEPHLGKSAIYMGNPSVIIHGMNLLLLRTKPDVLYPFFLNYLLNYYREVGVFIKIASRAVNQSSINQGKIKNLKIPLPPLEEQKQIAHILSTVDKKIEVEQKRKQILKELFKTMLHKLMNGEIRLKKVEI